MVVTLSDDAVVRVILKKINKNKLDLCGPYNKASQLVFVSLAR